MFHPELHNAMELEALVQQMGFLPFFRCAAPRFSIEEFTPGRYWFVDGVDGPWEWRMELARRGVVAYGKLFAKKRDWSAGSGIRIWQTTAAAVMTSTPVMRTAWPVTVRSA